MASSNLSGQPLGQYELREMIGIGGMGAVYLGYQRALDRLVAVKVMQFSLTHGGNFAQRFEREAKTAAALEHPHIVPVIDYGFDQGTSFIVMRYLSGGTLSQRLRQRVEGGDSPPSLEEIARLLGQVASALDYAHHQKVIHRDIKTSNIMFDNHGEAYLVDFGIAKLTESSAELTMTGVALGTAHYMAPEQVKGQALTPATDQYALAVVIYALVAGRMPFEAATPFAVQQRHISDMPTPVHTFRTQTPEAVTLVLERALAKDPNDRFPTVTAFAQAFQSAIAGQEGKSTGFFTFKVQQERPDVPQSVLPLSTPTPPYQHQPTIVQTPPPSGPTPIPPSANGGRRSPLMWIMGGIILVLIVVVGVLLASMGGSGEPTATVVVQVSPTTIIGGDVTEEVTQVVVVPSDTVSPTPLPTNTATASHTPSRTPTLTATRTPRLTNTNTPSPTPSLTATEQPAQIVIPGVDVTFRDDFDGNILSSTSWGGDGLRPRTENGQLILIGGNNRTTVTRCCLDENEGVLVLFQPVAGQIGMSLISGDWDSSERRRWAIDANTGTDWNTLYSYNSQDVHQVPLTSTSLQLNHWYYLLMRVSENGRFYTLVWDRDHPSQYLINVSRTPLPIGGWEGRSWTFELGGTTSRVLIESYEELRFPTDYDMPSTPPVATSGGVATIVTSTPRPNGLASITPMPTSAALGGQVETIFRDDFNRTALGTRWQNNFRPAVQMTDGQMVLSGMPNSLSDNVVRPGINPGEGVLVLFQYAPGAMGLYLDNGAGSGTSAYRQWGIKRSTSRWEMACQGTDVCSDIDDFSLIRDHWYYLLLRVSPGGVFRVYLWDRDNPTEYILSEMKDPPGSGWDAENWHFVIELSRGRLSIESYEELHFPLIYSMPIRPPIASSDGVVATATLRPTRTPTPRPTNIPRPTATPLPTSAAMPGGVEVTFSDEFNGSSLSSRWGGWGTRPRAENGQLVFIGSNWNAITRSNITENEGVLVLFQPVSGQVGMGFSSGDWEASTRRHWGVDASSGISWNAVYSYGRHDSSYFSLQTARLQLNHWYYLLMRVGDEGKVYIQIWDQDNPSRYLIDVGRIPPLGSNWDNRTWTFELGGNSSRTLVESYQELRFPADYEMPSTPPLTPQQAGTGLLGEYYNNINFTRLVTTRVDPRISFNWGSQSPATGIAFDTFSARWTGWIEPLYSEDYTFTIRSDDGARLWINGQRIINSWTDQSADVDRIGRIHLTAGQHYEIRLEYYENGGDARITLWWQSASQRMVVLPQSALYPADAPTATATPTPSRTPRPANTPRPTATPRASTSTFLGVMFEQDFTQTTNLGVSGSGRRTVEDGNGIWCMASTSEYRNVTFGSDTWTDYTVDLNIRITASGDGHGAILTRLNSSSYGYRHAIFIWSSGSWASQYYYPADDDLGGSNVNVHSGEWHHLRAEVEGSVIRTFVDEVLVATRNSDSRSRGYAAVEAAPGSSVCIDDIVVRSLNRSSQTVATARRGTATGNVNMRSGAGTGFSRVSGLTNGEEVFILNYTANRSWVYVRKIDSPIQGWVSADYIR